MKKTVILTLLLTTQTLFSKSNTELLGDVLAVSIPAVAYGTTLYTNDNEGEKEFYRAYGTTIGTAVLLKTLVKEERPDKSNERSFPSGHTASAISDAIFIHKRYGIEYAIPAYLGAIYTGYSRVHSQKHFKHDVLTGAIVGTLSTLYFTTSYKGVEVKAQLDSDYQGIKLSYDF